MTGPLISLLTDFGLTDPSVSACKGVILRIVPDARLLDISHGVTRHAVSEGAALLWAALPYVPAGVHMAVVDPGVGTERRPIALRTGRGDHLVGPDNGLLLPAAERLGGIVSAHLLEHAAYRLAPVSRTFHARDIFAPAAAHIARGVPIDAFGPAVDLASLVRLEIPAPWHVPGCLEASVVLVDAFGNAQLLAEPGDLEAAIGPVSSGDRLTVEPADGRPLGAGNSNRPVLAVGLRRRRGGRSAGLPGLLRTPRAGGQSRQRRRYVRALIGSTRAHPPQLSHARSAGANAGMRRPPPSEKHPKEPTSLRGPCSR